jgi:tetratricopeptide (TPR) repeat protein
MNARRVVSAPLSDEAVGTIILAGLEAHKAERFPEADILYAKALASHPNHPDALALSGALAFARGDTNLAIRLIGKAIRVHPGHLNAYLNLAEAYESSGRVPEAIETCQKAVVLAPDFPEGHSRLARLNAMAGAHALALSHARVALSLEPKLLEALGARGLALRHLKKFAEADQAYRTALDIAPDDVKILTGLGDLLNETDFIEEAERLFRRALDLKPNDHAILASLGQVVERSGDIAAAILLYDSSLEQKPDIPDIIFRRASCLRDNGDFEAAEAGYRNALRLQPQHSPSLLALARMKRLEDNSERRKSLTKLITDANQPPRHRIQAGFALGELLDRADEPDAAFQRYTEANANYKKLRAASGERFDRDELKSLVDVIDERLSLEFARDTDGWSTPTTLPVFVVGMPRSGTTLIEQICASHSQVVGAGELRGVQMAARRIGARNQAQKHIVDWDAPFARAEAEAHARELTRLAGDAVRVVDKTPLNLMRLGLIGAMFPKARVIWCRRDPRDVVISNHLMYFGYGNLYSTDQSDCAYAVRQINGLGEIWKRDSRLPILDVVYEDLVGDLDTHVRRIIDFLGLPWEPGCLDFQNTERHVGTPSSWQVRQPIYSNSVGRWRRYERHLGPMVATLAAND